MYFFVIFMHILSFVFTAKIVFSIGSHSLF